MQKYLYRTHSREEISQWQNMLSYFCYKRAYGGYANDTDEFKAGIIYSNREDLLRKLQHLNIGINIIPEGMPDTALEKEYPSEAFIANFRTRINEFPDLEQPGMVSIDNISVFVWIEKDHILFTLSGLEKTSAVTKKDLNACLELEAKFNQCGWTKYRYFGFAKDQYHFPPISYTTVNITKSKGPVLFKSLLSQSGKSLEAGFVRIFIRTLMSFIFLLAIILGVNSIASMPLISVIVVVLLIVLYSILRKAHTHILIDQQGIHYLNKLHKKTIRKLAWSDLRKSPLTYDIYQTLSWTATPTIPTVSNCIVWWESQNGKLIEYKETFNNGHIWYVGRDTKSLMKKFIEGVELFRPDLRIDPVLIASVRKDKNDVEVG
ncbi:hypothetical protein [Gynurincola endophyticus]|uniref:hypothetical protein n=1 Tax=Gynurincola endophyticus TaxID=2479004 RepID=UPI000F8E4110|nr:hypothetical protein [Gynurincola endophyticus]